MTIPHRCYRRDVPVEGFNTMKNRLRTLWLALKARPHALLLLYWPLHTAWYQLLRLYSDRMPHYIDISCGLDARIPFCEWFVIPYIQWYFYIAAAFIYTLVNSRDSFLRCCTIVFGCMLVSMIICTVFPNGIPEALRPDFDTLGRSNLGTALVKLIYARPSPRCTPPSQSRCSVSYGRNTNRRAAGWCARWRGL